MNKYFYIITLLVTVNVVYAQDDCDIPSELSSINGTSLPMNENDDWLFNEYNGQAIHPNMLDTSAPQGFRCNHVVLATTSNNDGSDAAFYEKSHDDPSEIRFRFLLNTENMLQSFVEGDKIVFYSFNYRDRFNNSFKFLKVRLVRGQNHANGSADWHLKFQWFDTVNGDKHYQTYTFNDSDDFVEFEFHWKKSPSSDSNDTVLYEKSQASVMIKTGNGLNDRPVYIMSPFDYDGGFHSTTTTLKGESSLGVINASSNPLELGDELRILSPAFYSN